MRRIFVILLFLIFAATLAYSDEVPSEFLEKGWTPLMWSTLFGKTDEVKSLIESGVDVTAKNSDGAMALDIAKQKGKKGSIKRGQVHS